MKAGTYFAKSWRVLREAALERRRNGTRSAIRFIASRLYSRSNMMVFEHRDKRLRGKLPEGYDIVPVSAVPASVYQGLLTEAGVGSNPIHFERGGVGWLIVSGNHAVAIGWAFRKSAALEHLGYDPSSSVYLGGFHVRSTHRGQGLYPYLLQRMFADSGATCAIAETSMDNAASQSGLIKAGFRRRGVAKRLTLCGCPVQCRIEEVPDCGDLRAEPLNHPSRAV